MHSTARGTLKPQVIDNEVKMAHDQHKRVKKKKKFTVLMNMFLAINYDGLKMESKKRKKNRSHRDGTTFQKRERKIPNQIILAIL